MKRHLIAGCILGMLLVSAVDLRAADPKAATPQDATPNAGVVRDARLYKITLLWLERPIADPPAAAARDGSSPAVADRSWPILAERLSPVERLNAALHREGTKVLSNPSIVTEEGRLVPYVAGGQHAYIAGFENGRTRREHVDVGTRLHVRATTVEPGRVRLELDLGVAELIEMRKVAVPADDGTNWTVERPLVDRRSVATTVELKLGEIFCLADRHGKGDPAAGTERELYVTVEECKP